MPAAIVLGSAFCVASPARALNHEPWLDQALEGVAAASDLSRVDASRAAARANLQVAQREAPWSVRSEVSQRATQPVIDRPDDHRSVHDTSLSNTLSYQRRDSVEVTLSTETTFNQRYNERVPTAAGVALDDPKARSNSLNLRTAYDVWKGGPDGTGALQARVDELGRRQELASSLEDEFKVRADVSDLLTDLFFTHCKITSLKDTETSVREVIEAGRSQARARVISRKDLLTYENLAVNLARQTASLEAVMRRTLTRLAGYLANGDLAPVKARLASADCSVRDADWDRLASESTTLEQGYLTSSWTEAASAFAEKQAETRLALARLGDDPSLKPFVAFNYRLPPTKDDTDGGSASVGITFDWTLPGGKVSSQLRAAGEDLRAARLRTALARRDSVSRQADWENQVAAQLALVPLFRQSMASATTLLDAVSAELKIGTADPLTFASAQTSLVDARSGLYDALAATRKARFQARESARLAKRGPTPTKDD